FNRVAVDGVRECLTQGAGATVICVSDRDDWYWGRCRRRRWILPAISPTGVQILTVLAVVRVRSAPDDHFTVGPNCRVIQPGSGRVCGAGGCPSVRAW